MVTLRKINYDNRMTMIIDGLSTDIKPLDSIEGRAITNASIFNCIDTSQIYQFDEGKRIWFEKELSNDGGNSYTFATVEDIFNIVNDR